MHYMHSVTADASLTLLRVESGGEVHAQQGQNGRSSNKRPLERHVLWHAL